MEGSDEWNILFDGMRYYYCLNASLVDYALSNLSISVMANNIHFGKEK